MPLKKIKKHAKYAPRSRRTTCTHSQHWHHGNTNNSNINNFTSSLTAPNNSMPTTSKPMYYGYPNEQIWQYIVMKYIHGLMNGQVDLNKQKPEAARKDKSVENIATKNPKDKKTALNNNPTNFLKYINVSTETSSSSTDLSSPEIATNVQLPLQPNKMSIEREKSSSDSSNKNLIKNKNRSPQLAAALGIKMSAELHQVGDVKAKHDSGDAASDDDSDDESSDETAANDPNREPSWQTVMQMMQQFGMMSSLCAGGSRATMPFGF